MVTLNTGVIQRAVESRQVNAPARVSARIRQRLEELGMTGREFAKRLDGHGDAWVSNLLANKFALSLRELDKAASILRVQPGDLVRQSDDGYDLAPTELRVIRGLRLLPPAVRDQMVILIEYLIGVAPETDVLTPSERALLSRVRRLEIEDRSLVERQIDRALRLAERDRAEADGQPAASGPPSGPIPRTPTRRKA